MRIMPDRKPTRRTASRWKECLSGNERRCDFDSLIWSLTLQPPGHNLGSLDFACLSLFEILYPPRCPTVSMDAMSQVASVASADYRTSWARAISCFQEVLSQDISKRHTMLVSGTEAIQACGRLFQWQQAGSLLGVLQGHALADLVSYNSAIGVCQKCQNWSLALGLLSVISLARLVPDIISFNSLMSACEGHWAFAVDLLGRVEKQGCESPNVITYSTVINACDKGSCWFVALFILETMQKRVVLPNVVTFSSAISGCAEGGRWDIAIFLLIAMAAWRVDRNIIS